MSEIGNDVNSAENTATDSSIGEQTNQDTGVEAKAEGTQTTGENTQTETKEVPEVNRWAEKARKAEKELARLQAEVEAIKKTRNTESADPQSEAVKEQLRQMGFITREEQEAEMKRRDEDSRVQAEISRLETTFDGKDGRPKFDRQEIIDFAVDKQIGDLEAAYWAKHREALVDWHIKQASSKSRGIKTEASDGSGSAEAGTTDADLKGAIAKGDKTALRTFLKRFAPNS